jgi:hypothetical protein
MDNLVIEATKSSPRIFFDAERGALEIRGKSYPENVVAFYAPALEWLRAFLPTLGDKPLRLDLEIIYLNSSSSKVFFNLLELLEEWARSGGNILVNWCYHEDNESALDCGEEFMEELDHLNFKLVKIVKD